MDHKHIYTPECNCCFSMLEKKKILDYNGASLLYINPFETILYRQSTTDFMRKELINCINLQATNTISKDHACNDLYAKFYLTLQDLADTGRRPY